MTLDIFYTIGTTKDSIRISADTIEEIRNIAKKELQKRNLDIEKNDVYSIPVD